MLKTTFWKKAAAQLPAAVRSRYIAELEQAERWELVLDRVFEAYARLKNGFVRNEPRGAH
jgi:hypothetical protein